MSQIIRRTKEMTASTSDCHVRKGPVKAPAKAATKPQGVTNIRELPKRVGGQATPGAPSQIEEAEGQDLSGAPSQIEEGGEFEVMTPPSVGRV